MMMTGLNTSSAMVSPSRIDIHMAAIQFDEVYMESGGVDPTPGGKDWIAVPKNA